MRTLIIAAFLFAASFAGPHAAFAVLDTGNLDTTSLLNTTSLSPIGGFCTRPTDCASYNCDTSNSKCIATVTVTDTGGSNQTVTDTGGSSNTNASPDVQLINPLTGGANLESFLMSILSFIIRIGAIAIVLMLVFVGYKFVAAQGNPGEIEAAKKMLLWTLIGALILLGAQAIAAAIKATVMAIGAGG